MPEIVITETLSVTEHDITDEERALAKKYNRLVDTCLDWALLQMRVGLPSIRLNLTKSVITSASRLAALDTKTSQEEHRVAFQSLLAEMATIDAVATPALTVTTVDQDEER